MDILSLEFQRYLEPIIFDMESDIISRKDVVNARISLHPTILSIGKNDFSEIREGYIVGFHYEVFGGYGNPNELVSCGVDMRNEEIEDLF